MTGLDEYQDWTVSTAKYYKAGECEPESILYCSIGLTEEAGEVAGKVKKAMRGDDGGERGVPALVKLKRSEAIKLEMGDCLYYLARLAAECGFALSEVAAGNKAKLEDRKARGVLKGSGDNR